MHLYCQVANSKSNVLEDMITDVMQSIINLLLKAMIDHFEDKLCSAAHTNDVNP